MLSMTRHNGTWGVPRPVPGMKADPSFGLWLACPSAGDCVLAADAPGRGEAHQIMVARLAHGSWSRARAVPGLAALRPGQWGLVSSLACGAAGWCALAGQTEKPEDFGGGQPFVATEHNGAWSRAQAVPGLAGLTQGWSAGVDAVSCDPQGTCTAAGDYRDHAVHNDEPYVTTERSGRWGRAHPVTGSTSLGASEITALSCTAPGDCSAAGTEGSNDTGTPVQMFTVTETGGTWQKATQLRGTITLKYPVDEANITALTCTAPGQCTALGAYATNADSEDSVPVQGVPFEAVQAHGTWTAIRAIRGLPASAVAWVSSVSCASAGNCAAGGYWLTNDGSEYNLSSNHAFLATETRGAWTAQRVPGLSAMHSSDSAIHLVSCRPRRGCTAIGDFRAGARQIFTSSRR